MTTPVNLIICKIPTTTNAHTYKCYINSLTGFTTTSGLPATHLEFQDAQQNRKYILEVCEDATIPNGYIAINAPSRTFTKLNIDSIISVVPITINY